MLISTNTKRRSTIAKSDAVNWTDFDGIAYTEETLTNFLYDNTGKSNAGGGGSAITTETVAEATSKGDILYLDATGKYSLADALLSTKSKTRMVVATESGAINDEIKVGSEVLLDGYVGLVTGDNYYLNEGGGITNDPTIFQSGSITRLVGTAKSATELQVDIDTTFLHTQSPLATRTTIQTADYNAVTGDFIDMTTGVVDRVITLSATPTVDDNIIVRKADAGIGKITINGNGKLINGLATDEMLNQYTAVSYIYNGTEWCKL